MVPAQDPNVIVGTSTFDDAAVYEVAPGLGIVATVDFISPVVPEPALYGEVAAAHARSDIYAMGASPLFALNLVYFPRDMLPLDSLAEIIRGSSNKMAEAGCLVLGGHSIDDFDLKFGFAVIGTVKTDQIVSNARARPGDMLVLTKPLGTGVISTATKAGVATDAASSEAAAVMTTLNRSASDAMQYLEICAATDVMCLSIRNGPL